MTLRAPFPTVAASLLTLLLPAAAAAQKPSATSPPRGVEVARESGYAELRVDGKPFFLHSATFFYYRLPRDLWSSSLDRHRALGINTIDLPIPWNWHEPREGERDFDGRTNPRRDLRGLLQMLAEKGFKVIARPGPILGGDWRYGGYPEWLLMRPEYATAETALREGRAPLAGLATNPEAAAHAWMAKATHIEHVKKWLAAVAAELAPFGTTRTLTVRVRNDKGDVESKTISGPLILVQVGDSFPPGTFPFASGAELARYRTLLREALRAGGLDALFFVDGGSAEAPGGMAAVASWFQRPPPNSPGAAVLAAREAGEVEAAVAGLQGQDALPPLLLGFQAGWPAPADDVRPREAHPANTLLASRLAIAHGARGLNYFPLQDTLTPAAYETPGVNRHYRWDAALDVAGNEKPRSRFVTRNADMLAMWGEQLAATHMRADFGLVLRNGAAGQRAAEQASRVTYLAGMNAERLNPEVQPLEDLLRHTLILLAPLDEPLSDAAQRKLLDYVRRGGTLAVAGPRPSGETVAELWKDAPREAKNEGPQSWSFGQGRVAEVGDLFSWVAVEEDFTQTRMRGEAASAVQTLHRLLNVAGTRAVIRRNTGGTATGELAITELVSNAGTGPLGARTGGQGFLMATNLSPEEAAEETVEVLPPHAGARSGVESVSLPLHVPARESMLLPLHIPLCATAKPEDRCRDEVIAAGAELLDIRRDGRTLELTFYTPARATVLLRLAQAPRRVQMEEFRPEAHWVVERNELRISVPRGAWPNFLRVLRIGLQYTPFLPEPPKENHRGRDDYDYAVSDAVRLPIDEDVSLPTEPPLIVLDENRKGRVLMQGVNYDELGRTLDFRVEGPARGSDGVALGGFETRQVVVDLKASPGSNGDSIEEGLLPGELEAKSGRDQRKSPLKFISIPKDGTASYQFDFDRDGAREWVLEDAAFRLIISPEAGGRIMALVEKESQKNLLTSLGGIVDGRRSATAVYSAQWGKDEKNPSLSLRAGDGRIEKVARIAEDGLVVDYTVQPAAAEPLAVSSSVPASSGPRGTQFCWKTLDAQDGRETCEPFTAGGQLALPGGVLRVEVREPGRPTLAVEWQAGRVQIEMKQFSALLLLEFPAGAEKNQLRYKVKREE